MARPARVLHVLKYYRPRFTGEGAFMERCTAFMQVLAPDVEHDLLVTETPEPQEPPQVCSTLNRICYLSKRPLSGPRQELALLGWFVRNLHRYDTIHIRTHVDWHFLSYFATKLARRRLVLSSTLDDSVPVLVSRYRPSHRPIVSRLFRMFDQFISINPRLRDEVRGVVPPGRCHLVPCGITCRVRSRRTRAAAQPAGDPRRRTGPDLCRRADAPKRPTSSNPQHAGHSA